MERSARQRNDGQRDRILRTAAREFHDRTERRYAARRSGQGGSRLPDRTDAQRRHRFADARRTRRRDRATRRPDPGRRRARIDDRLRKLPEAELSAGHGAGRRNAAIAALGREIVRRGQRAGARQHPPAQYRTQSDRIGRIQQSHFRSEQHSFEQRDRNRGVRTDDHTGRPESVLCGPLHAKSGPNELRRGTDPPGSRTGAGSADRKMGSDSGQHTADRR